MVFTPTTRSNLKRAIDEWIAESINANTSVTFGQGTGTYGEMNDWDVSNVTNMSELFRNGRTLQQFPGSIIDTTSFNSDISGWTVSQVTNMSEMFEGATIFNQDISGWDVSLVTDMSEMFKNTQQFRFVLSKWTLKNNSVTVTDMFKNSTRSYYEDTPTITNQKFGYYFSNNNSLVTAVNAWEADSAVAEETYGDIRTWNVSQITNMSSLFSGSSIEYDISGWDVNNVTNMNYMFYNASSFDSNLSKWALNWDVTVTDMFSGASNLNFHNRETPTISSNKLVFKPYTKATLVTAVDAWLANSTTATTNYGDITTWDVSLITDMSSLFSSSRNSNASGFNSDISGWNVSSVVNMSSMFKGASSFNQNISGWERTTIGNTSTLGAVTDMSSMFNGAQAFDQDISGWTVSAVENMSSMFNGAQAFDQDISGWTVSAVENMSSMFNGATSFNQNLYKWTFNNSVTVTDMFSGASNLNFHNRETPTISSNKLVFKPYTKATLVTAVDAWLANSTTATTNYGDITTWDVSLITDMSSLFSSTRNSNASGFNSDITGWTLTLVTNMSSMFKGASSFDLDISGWNVSAVTDMSSMFNGASSFNLLLSGWSLKSGVIVTDMFLGATSMKYHKQGTPVVVNNILIFQLAVPEKSLLVTAVDAWLTNPTTTTSTYGNIATWSVSLITDMSELFSSTRNSNASGFNSDISEWDVSAVTNMSSMFNGASSFDQDIGNWNVSAVKNMTSMFEGATIFNQDISGWSVGNVTDMTSMFKNSVAFAQEIRAWGLSAGNSNCAKTDMFTGATAMHALYGSTGDSDDLKLAVSGFANTPNTGSPATNFFTLSTSFSTASGGEGLTTIVNNWTNYTPSSSLLKRDGGGGGEGEGGAGGGGEDSLSAYKSVYTTYGHISRWRVGEDIATVFVSDEQGGGINEEQNQITSMAELFKDKSTFNDVISNWDVSNVLDMTRMFNNAERFNQDISSWNVSAVTNMTEMFKSAIRFNQDLSAWKTNGNDMETNITLTNMFQGATAMLGNSGVVVTPTYANWETQTICFYGFVNVMTDCGLKQIKDLKSGDMILTNDGYQPLAELDVGFNPSDKLLMSKLKSTDFMVKIPKDFFIENVPSEDVYVTKTHPLSVKITSADNDKDFEFLHLFVEELMELGDGIEYVRKNSETKLYNLIFDNHYEISVGNMKFLSHHPNHLNKNKYLVEGNEVSQQNRTKKIYAIEGQCFFDTITLKDLLKQKPENITDKEYLASVLRFD